MNINVGIRGQYKIVVSRGGDTVADTDWFDNVILDQGLHRMGQGGSSGAKCITHIHLGTSNTAPSTSQTGMLQFLTAQQVQSVATGGATADSTVFSSNNNTITMTWKAPFAQGAVIGDIAEVGSAWAASGETAFSRARIKSRTGEDTTITVTSIDTVTAYYRLIVHPPLGDVTGTLTIDGAPYPYTLRAAAINSAWMQIRTLSSNNNTTFSGTSWTHPSQITAYGSGSTLGTVLQTPGGGGGTAAANATDVGNTYFGAVGSYTNNFTRDYKFGFDPTRGNAPGGIQSLSMVFANQDGGTTMQYQMRFDTPVPKTSTSYFTITLRVQWARL